MISSIKKPKLPREQTYIYKTSQIEKVLNENNIETNVYLNYKRFYQNCDSKCIFNVLYWLPNENVPYDRFYVSIHALKTDDVKLIMSKMNDIALPAFGKWAKNILSLPSNSTKLNHNMSFNVYFENEDIFIIAN